MNSLLLSDRGLLQVALQRLLQLMDERSVLWRCEDTLPAQVCLRQQPQVELVVLDLSWCGVERLYNIVSALRPYMGPALLVLLADSASDALATRSTGVVADLIVLRSEPGNVVRTAIKRALERRRDGLKDVGDALYAPLMTGFSTLPTQPTSAPAQQSGPAALG
ncbi:MAG: hypothetical protein RJA44_2041 [Pseudomonadota bacterium]